MSEPLYSAMGACRAAHRDLSDRPTTSTNSLCEVPELLCVYGILS